MIGWRNWDPVSLVKSSLLPDGPAVRLSLVDRRTGHHQSEFRWPSLVKLGPSAYDGSYAAVRLRSGAAVFDYEMSSEGMRLFVRVSPVSDCAGCEFRMEIGPAQKGTLVTSEQAVIWLGADSAISFSSPTPGSALKGTSIVSDASKPFILAAQPVEQSPLEPETREATLTKNGSLGRPELEAQAKAAIAEQRTALQSRLGSSLKEAICAACGWNTIWSPARCKEYLVSTRDWCVFGNYGDYVLFGWDSFLSALLASVYDPDLAKAALLRIFEGQTEAGFVPSIQSEIGVSDDRSHPPVGALCVWMIYSLTADSSILESSLDPLLRWHRWWPKARDGKGDGLLEWGSHPAPLRHPQWQAHNLWAARYESGMDNSQMYDDASFDPKANVMELYDVGLTSLWAADSVFLAKIARELRKPEEVDRLEAEARRNVQLIDERLWDEARSIYANRFWDGRWSDRVSPTSFYPVLTGMVSQERAKRLLDHLRDPKEFWTEFPIPTVPRADPAFAEQYYWRGRVWPPVNFLIYCGLKLSGFDAVASDLAERSLALFEGEWAGKSHIHENYNARSGDGDDTPESDPCYTWGALLALIALWESGELDLL
jgi:putative isomerase